MANPILTTPPLEGKEAKKFLEMHREKTISKRDKEVLQTSVELYLNHKK